MSVSKSGPRAAKSAVPKSKSLAKSDLVAAIRDATDCTAAQAAAAYDSLFGAITSTVKKGGKVSVHGFGTFSLSKRAARTGRNPANGETIKIAASKSIRFKMSSSLKGAI